MLCVRDPLLVQVGRRVRQKRERLGLSQKQLADRALLSVRFLAQLEHGDGNISLRRFAQLAAALGTDAAELLAAPPDGRPHVALLGLRGAGKSTVGPRLARCLGLRFVELDDRVARAAGMSLAEVFELHGEAYYRRLEREALRLLLAEGPGLVIATGGSIVNDRESFRMLRDRAVTLWLKARPEDHWNRVVRQGDRRPMGKNPHAFEELRALLAAREELYATADHTVDTTQGVDETVAAAVKLIELS
jgi:XRE family aerobic/anaerobic benzoate catabolism transcriptional regulator